MRKTAGLEAVGQCRRNPPNQIRDNEVRTWEQFPWTPADGWCGELEAKEQKMRPPTLPVIDITTYVSLEREYLDVAEQIRKYEREACAKIAEGPFLTPNEPILGLALCELAKDIARRIRNRTQ
jgi:hypothetical protein